MRISDWSSDVCSSDLEMNFEGKIPLRHGAFGSWSINDVSITMEGFFQGVEEDTTQDPQLIEWAKQAGQIVDEARRKELYSMALKRIAEEAYWEIGRASCRERVCQYV